MVSHGGALDTPSKTHHLSLLSTAVSGHGTRVVLRLVSHTKCIGSARMPHPTPSLVGVPRSHGQPHQFAMTSEKMTGSTVRLQPQLTICSGMMASPLRSALSTEQNDSGP